MLPAWLSFDAATRTFAGTPPADFNGALTITVTASDGTLSASDDFVLNITPQNDAPVVAIPLADQSSPEDAAVSFVLPAGAFTDIDSASLTLSTPALPAWLSFDAATRTFAGTPPADFNGALTITVTASDGTLSASDDFVLNITPQNDAPVVAIPLADLTAAEDAAFSFVLPAGVFTDAEGDALTYAAALEDGGALPAWLSFDAATGTFSGTPSQADTGALSIRVTASDGSLSSSDVFQLTVGGTNDAPVLAVPLADQASAEDAAFSITLPADAFTDVDPGDVLTLSAALSDGSALPSWIVFDPATRTFSGTPPLNYDAQIEVRVTATDALGATASDIFTLDITPQNDAPVVAIPLADQSSPEDAAVSFVLPAGAFTDVDSASLTLTTSVLPAWLSFDAATRTFAGTPPADFNGALTVTVTASDGTLSASDDFVLNITPVDEPASGLIAFDDALQNGTSFLAFGGVSKLSDPGDPALGTSSVEINSAAWTQNGLSRDFALTPDTQFLQLDVYREAGQQWLDDRASWLSLDGHVSDGRKLWHGVDD